jgi:hypothetical protein
MIHSNNTVTSDLFNFDVFCDASTITISEGTFTATQVFDTDGTAAFSLPNYSSSQAGCDVITWKTIDSSKSVIDSVLLE